MKQIDYLIVEGKLGCWAVNGFPTVAPDMTPPFHLRVLRQVLTRSGNVLQSKVQEDVLYEHNVGTAPV